MTSDFFSAPDSPVDLERLSGWMDAEGLGAGEITQAERLTGGTQNILVRFSRSGRDYVLRRPPANPRENSNETMRREARVLGALAGSDVPHPALIAACPDTQVLGAAFYLMEPVNGFNPAGSLPDFHASSPDIRHRMGLSLVEAITKLGAVDHVAAGLGDFGRPDGFLERQAPRWKKLLDSFDAMAGWDGRKDLPGIDRIGDWLNANLPDTFRPGLMHGDYHLGNVMFEHDGPELAAIVDWELVTIGDPLLDLGWLLATWPDGPDHNPTGAVGTKPWAGFPDAEELVAHYGERSDRDTRAIRWYAVLGCYKLGIIQEGTYARACAGKVDMETGRYLHTRTIWLLERALRWIEDT